jgi:transcriptional regulator with XRE-family HTH domain
MVRRRLRDAQTRADVEDARTRRWLAWTLALVRKQRGVTQTELARRTGTHQSAISDIEQGQIDFRLSTIQKIARALGVTLEVHLRNDSWTSLYSWTQRSWPYDSSVRQAKVIESPDVKELRSGLPPRQRAGPQDEGEPEAGPSSVVNPAVVELEGNQYLSGEDLVEMAISRVSSASAEVSDVA